MLGPSTFIYGSQAGTGSIIVESLRIYLGRNSQYTAPSSTLAPSLSQVAPMICPFRSLEALILGSIGWRSIDRPSSLLRLPHRPHALELDNSQLTLILEWLCSFLRYAIFV